MSPLSIDTAALVLSYGAPARLRPNAAGAGGAAGEKLHAQAQDFEAMFLSSMMQHMFTAVGDNGPLGNGEGVGVWRSLLTEQYAKSIAKAGGIGIANHVYQSLLGRRSAPTALSEA